jgi:Na+/H+-dicarboxylate symporter
VAALERVALSLEPIGTLWLNALRMTIAMAMGVPVELLPLLLAVEVIPDILRTVGNVTADMTVTAIVARSQGAIAADAGLADIGQPRTSQ